MDVITSLTKLLPGISSMYYITQAPNDTSAQGDQGNMPSQQNLENVKLGWPQYWSLTHHQGWDEYPTYEYEYGIISTQVVLDYNVFSIFMFIIWAR